MCACTVSGIVSKSETIHLLSKVFYIISIAGHWVFKNSMYCASKFAVTALTEGYRTELRAMQSNIKVSVSE